MFKAEIKADTLKTLVNVISTVVDEVKIAIHPDSLGIRAIDPARVAMINIDVSKEAFVSFEADEGEMGFDLDKIKNIIKLAGPGDTILMEHDPNQGRLSMTIGNIIRRMSLVDTNGMNDPSVPPLELGTKVQINADLLQKGMRATETIDSDHIKMEADSEGFTLSCDNDLDFASLKVPASELKALEAQQHVASSYSRDYFSNIVKSIPGNVPVSLQFDPDYPIKLLFELSDGNAHASYLLAPRIEGE
ncbi:MAG: DNA polymerase sliding clamp [archaeon]|nr:DNA polymerase sliding clamp [archaeon]